MFQYAATHLSSNIHRKSRICCSLFGNIIPNAVVLTIQQNIHGQKFQQVHVWTPNDRTTNLIIRRQKCISIQRYLSYLTRQDFLVLCVYMCCVCPPTNNFRTIWRIFMTLDTNIVSLKVSPFTYFFIPNCQYYWRDGRPNTRWERNFAFLVVTNLYQSLWKY